MIQTLKFIYLIGIGWLFLPDEPEASRRAPLKSCPASRAASAAQMRRLIKKHTKGRRRGQLLLDLAAMEGRHERD